MGCFNLSFYFHWVEKPVKNLSRTCQEPDFRCEHQAIIIASSKWWALLLAHRSISSHLRQWLSPISFWLICHCVNIFISSSSAFLLLDVFTRRFFKHWIPSTPFKSGRLNATRYSQSNEVSQEWRSSARERPTMLVASWISASSLKTLIGAWLVERSRSRQLLYFLQMHKKGEVSGYLTEGYIGPNYSYSHDDITSVSGAVSCGAVSCELWAGKLLWALVCRSLL